MNSQDESSCGGGGEYFFKIRGFRNKGSEMKEKSLGRGRIRLAYSYWNEGLPMKWVPLKCLHSFLFCIWRTIIFSNVLGDFLSPYKTFTLSDCILVMFWRLMVEWALCRGSAMRAQGSVLQCGGVHSEGDTIPLCPDKLNLWMGRGSCMAGKTLKFKLFC